MPESVYKVIELVGTSTESWEKAATVAVERASKTLRDLRIAEVVKQNELKPDETRVRALIEEMASAYQEPEQVVAWYLKNEKQLNEVRSVVLEEQVVDTVLGKAKVTDKSVSYEEAVKPAEAPQVA